MAKPVPAKPSTLTKHVCRAIAQGFANNQLYEAGVEFEHVVDASLTPASWFETLDEGEPVSARVERNVAPVSGVPVQQKSSGFAAGSVVI